MPFLAKLIETLIFNLGAMDTLRYANKVKLYGFKLSVCNEALMMRQYGIFFPKHSFLVPSFDEKLRILMENGLIGYWVEKFTSTNDNQQHTKEPTQLTLSHLFIAFQIIFIGSLLSCIAFAIELLSVQIKILKSFFVTRFFLMNNCALR